MANSISLNQSVTSVIDGVRTTLSSNTTQQTTSSNFIAGGQDVVSTGATALSMGSLTDVSILTVLNDNTGLYTASVIQVTGSAAIDCGAILLPGYQATIPWSGSMPAISAKVVSGWPPGTATPAKGTVQWLVQQS